MEFDVKIPVMMTVRVAAPDATKAEWIMRHRLDSRHPNDPTAGLILSVGHGCSAQIMTTVFNAADDVEVSPC